MEVGNVANRTKTRVIRRRFRHARFLLFILLVLACLMGVYQFLNSAVFAVSEIRVTGNHVLQADEVVRVSGLIAGVNIFKINTAGVVNRLRVMPLVEKVTVQRRFPDTIEIQIQERTPVAVVAEDGGFVVVDRWCVYLRKLDTILGVSEPLVTDVDIGSRKGPGQKITSAGLQAAIAVIEKMDRDLLAQISEINARNPDGLILYTMTGVEVRFGSSEEVEQKQEFLKSFLADKRWQKPVPRVAYIDLSFEGPPVIKYRDD
jgi:cell division protein FtsQ